MLRLWLPLNGDLHNQGLDDVTVTNNGATVNNAGKIGKCYEFDGSSNYITIPQGYIGDEWSYSIWAYTTSSSSTQCLGCCRTSVGSGFALFLIGGKLRIDSGGNYVQHTTTYTYPTNTWFHLTITYGDGKTSYYINGEFKNSYTDVISSTYWGNIFSVGASQVNGSTYGNFLYGRVNDVRIYNHCLSPKEIKELSKGLVLHYPLNRDGFGGDNLASISSYGRSSGGNVYPPNTDNSLVIDGNKFIVTANPGDSIGAVATNISSSTITVSAKTTYTGTGRRIYRKWFDDSGNMVGSYTSEAITIDNGRILCTLNVPTGAIKITFGLCYPYNEPYEVWDLKVEEGSVATPWVPNSADALYSDMGLDDGIEYDVSGYGNNGSVTGTLTYSNDTPRYMVSTYFNGANYASLVSPCTEVKTISFWANWDTIPSGQSVLFVDGKSHIGFGLMVYGILCGTSGIGNFKTFSKTSLVANEWYHFVIVNPGDATSLDRKLYINGVEQTATTHTSNWTYGVDQLQLGKRVSTSDGFKGKMSDFRMYSTALSPDDILALYNTPTSITNNGTLLTQGEIAEV